MEFFLTSWVIRISQTLSDIVHHNVDELIPSIKKNFFKSIDYNQYDLQIIQNNIVKNPTFSIKANRNIVSNIAIYLPNLYTQLVG